MLGSMMIETRGSVKGQIGEPEHIKGREKGAERGHPIENIVTMCKGMAHNLVLTPEPGKRRDTGDGDRSDEEQHVASRESSTLSPPILRMSCSPERAWITEPADKKSRALKNAWVMRWKIAAV